MFNLLFQPIAEYVYELLQSDDVGLKKLEIPQEKEYSTSSFQKQVQWESSADDFYISWCYVHVLTIRHFNFFSIFPAMPTILL